MNPVPMNDKLVLEVYLLRSCPSPRGIKRARLILKNVGTVKPDSSLPIKHQSSLFQYICLVYNHDPGRLLEEPSKYLLKLGKCTPHFHPLGVMERVYTGILAVSSKHDPSKLHMVEACVQDLDMLGTELQSTNLDLLGDSQCTPSPESCFSLYPIKLRHAAHRSLVIDLNGRTTSWFTLNHEWIYTVSSDPQDVLVAHLSVHFRKASSRHIQYVPRDVSWLFGFFDIVWSYERDYMYFALESRSKNLHSDVQQKLQSWCLEVLKHRASCVEAVLKMVLQPLEKFCGFGADTVLAKWIWRALQKKEELEVLTEASGQQFQTLDSILSCKLSDCFPMDCVIWQRIFDSIPDHQYQIYTQWLKTQVEARMKITGGQNCQLGVDSLKPYELLSKCTDLHKFIHEPQPRVVSRTSLSELIGSHRSYFAPTCCFLIPEQKFGRCIMIAHTQLITCSSDSFYIWAVGKELKLMDRLFRNPLRLLHETFRGQSELDMIQALHSHNNKLIVYFVDQCSFSYACLDLDALPTESQDIPRYRHFMETELLDIDDEVEYDYFDVLGVDADSKQIFILTSEFGIPFLKILTLEFSQEMKSLNLGLLMPKDLFQFARRRPVYLPIEDQPSLFVWEPRALILSVHIMYDTEIPRCATRILLSVFRYVGSCVTFLSCSTFKIPPFIKCEWTRSGFYVTRPELGDNLHFRWKPTSVNMFAFWIRREYGYQLFGIKNGRFLKIKQTRWDGLQYHPGWITLAPVTLISHSDLILGRLLKSSKHRSDKITLAQFQVRLT